MDITFIDIIVFTIVTFSTLMGVYRGFMRLSISIVAFISSFIMAYFLYNPLHIFISKFFTNQLLLVILSGTAAYVISLIFFSFLTSKLYEMIKSLSGGFVDRFFGLLLGFLRGSIICLVVYITIAIFVSKSLINAKTAEDVFNNTTEEKYPDWLKRPFVFEYFENTSKNIISLLPEDILKSIKIPSKETEEDISDIFDKTIMEKDDSSIDQLFLNEKHKDKSSSTIP